MKRQIFENKYSRFRTFHCGEYNWRTVSGIPRGNCTSGRKEKEHMGVCGGQQQVVNSVGGNDILLRRSGAKISLDRHGATANGRPSK